MRFVIVTGMSGGGKRTALKMLEDAGFYCVDNLPIPLIEKFVELIATPGSEISKVALDWMSVQTSLLKRHIRLLKILKRADMLMKYFLWMLPMKC